MLMTITPGSYGTNNDVVNTKNKRDLTMDDIDDARRAMRERNGQASRRQGLRVELVQGKDGSHAR